MLEETLYENHFSASGQPAYDRYPRILPVHVILQNELLDFRALKLQKAKRKMTFNNFRIKKMQKRNKI